MPEAPVILSCVQTASVTGGGRQSHLLSRFETRDPVSAAYWVLARLLDSGVQLGDEALCSIWHEIRSLGGFFQIAYALAQGCPYVLELSAGGIDQLFSVRPTTIGQPIWLADLVHQGVLCSTA
ncbi:MULTISPECIES: hypothetical protein [Streptacidiphilus]|uniref:Uncharacterized protein n=1 Tax=Streptacidiphilus cavernicola TaxID=3342716 RepID=A0ABV6UP48_9ACTN|nr:hypothetical protein [Streptacidiphilus jeojiense]